MKLLVSAALIVFSATPRAADVQWRLPEWNAVGAEIGGSLVVSPVPVGPMDATCAMPDGNTCDIEINASPDAPNHFEFQLPVLEQPGNLMIHVDWRSAEGNAHTASQTVPVGDSVEIEISGVAAEVLEFPLKGWPADVLFVPCCNLNGGILQMLRYPSNPVTSEGLSDAQFSEFILARPDDMVRGTAGLSLVFRPQDAAGESTVYRWNDGAWELARGVVKDDETRTLTLACPNGGLFVLGRSNL